MFETDAKEYARGNFVTCLYDSKAVEQIFRDAAKFGYSKASDKLTKAKEIIKQLMYASRDCIAWYCLCDKAKQFLEEIDK